jgi:hypothetical protein
MADEPNGGQPADRPMNDESAHERPPVRLCGRRTKSGQPCKRACVPGRPRCKLHGGNNAVGPANGRWKGGRYSKYLPKGVAADYKRACQDSRLLQLDDEIALLQARIAGLLRELGQVEAPPWGAAAESLGALVMAVRDGEGVEEALAEHARIVRTGAAAAANREQLWDKVQRAIDLKGRTARLEWKRQMDLCVALPAAEVLTLVSAILAAVEDLTHDYTGGRELYRRICARAIHYLPPECRQSGTGTVIDNEPAP